MQYLSNFNLNQNELQNARIQNLATAPASPVKGQVYFDTTLNQLRSYNGTKWISLDTPVTVGVGTGLTNSGTTDDPIIAMPAVGIAGTYRSVTTDAQGRVTAGTNPTTLAGYGITDAQPKDNDLTAIAALAGTSGLLKKTATDTWALDTNTYLTGNQSVTISGDIAGTGTTAITATLPNIVTAGTATKITYNAKGQVTGGATLAASDIPSLTLSKITDAGTAASKNTGTAAGNVPILDASGKLDTTVLPGLALTTTNVVADQASMLALTAEPGDLAVRTDINKTFVLKTAGASTLANWQELLTPTDAVTSVAGKTGVVTLTSSDVGLGNVTNESKATMFASPTFTGTPAAPTPVTSSNDTTVATTAFVKAQGYVTGTGAVTSFSGGTTGLTPAAATTGAVTLGGVLDEVNGGTGQSSYAVGDILFASTTTALSKLADIATGNVLLSGGVGVAPSYGKVGLTTHVSGTLAVGNGGTGITATTQGGIMYGSSAAGLAVTAAGTAGQVLKSNGASAPTWQTLDLTYLPDSAFKKSVKVATTADLAAVSSTATTLTGGLVVIPTIDGISTFAVGDRILVKNQATAAQNGIYQVTTLGVAATTAWVLTRVADGDAASEIAGATVNVDQGTVNGGWLFSNQFKVTDTVGTTAMNWYRVLNSLDFTSPAFTGTPTAPTATVGTNTTQLATTAFVQSQITSQVASTAPRKYTATIGDGAATSFTKAHGLGNADLAVTVRNASTGEIIFCDITVDATNVVLSFASAPALNAYKIVAIG